MRKPALFSSLVASTSAVAFAAVVATSTLLTACGGPNEYMVPGMGPAAGSDAEVVVGRMEDSTTKLVKIEIKHLLPPERVGEGLTAYVVWFVAEDQAPAKAGRLAFDEDSRVGTMQATSAFEKFTVVVTAEETDQATTPSKHVVLQQEVE